MRLASNLEGKLLLIHGTSATAPGVSNTMKMVAALIQANKPFDLIVLPEEGIISTRYHLARSRAAVLRGTPKTLMPFTSGTKLGPLRDPVPARRRGHG